MSLFDPNNPNAHAHLRRLAESLPAMAMRQVKAGLRRDQSKVFSRYCPICNEFFRPKAKSIIADTGNLKAEHCSACEDQLKDGFTALVTASHRHVFAKIDGAAGEVKTITDAEMNVFYARDAAQQMWNVMVKHCGAKPEDVMKFFHYSLTTARPFKFGVGDYVLCFSNEGVPSVERMDGKTDGLEAVNADMRELLK